jgi:putative ABC transport system permease protein
LGIIKQTIRHLCRRKLYTGITITGLGIGLGCVILMATYLIHEFSFDRYHSQAVQIYRLIDGKKCGTFYAMGEEFKKDIPEIENVLRLFSVDDVQIKENQQFIKENNLILSDPSIVNLFDIQLLKGNSNNQLKEPNSLMISEKIAHKYFPGNNPIGTFMQIAIHGRIYNLKISGVFKNLPSYSSLQTDLIGNISIAFPLLWDITYTIGFRQDKPISDFLHEWKRNDFTTFVLLKPKTNKVTVERKCAQICLRHRTENANGGIHLQPLTDIYLHSYDLDNTRPFLMSQLDSLRVFAAIGLLILMVACLNFILISNADSELSIKEIACRKVNGASRQQIISSVLSRSVIIAFISLIPALIFVAVSIPYFNAHFQKDLSLHLFLKLPYVIALFSLTLLTGISAGIYLGYMTACASPLRLFRKEAKRNHRNFWKASMIVVQLVVFILLVISVSFMKKQFDYAINKDLGLNKENVMKVNLNDDEFRDKMTFIQSELLKNANVIACQPTSFTIPPSDSYLNVSYKDENGEGKEQEALVFGPGVLELLQIPLKDGQSFTEANAKDRNNILINEAAARKYNVKAGEKISHFNVLGITENFHYHSIHRPIQPIFIIPQYQYFSYLLIKTNGSNGQVATGLKQICGAIAPNILFQYEMLDNLNSTFYEKEKNQMGMIGFFTAIALTLSMMGLFGFVSLNVSKRTKEIGIRKISGAKSLELLNMLNVQYVQWVVIAFVIACPIALFAIQKWLTNFAYKTVLSWWVFFMAGSFALVIALITVSWQSWLAATKNPVEALRYE